MIETLTQQSMPISMHKTYCLSLIFQIEYSTGLTFHFFSLELYKTLKDIFFL